MFPKHPPVIKVSESMWQHVNEKELVAETRDVNGFDRLVMKDYGELIITQGAEESLVVEAHHSLLPKIKSEVAGKTLVLGFGRWLDKLGEAFTTSLTRRPIRYHVTVKNLVSLKVFGMARIQADGLETNRLKIFLSGANTTQLKDLNTDLLLVEMAAAANLVITGRASEQRIKLKGSGQYDGQDLYSDRARITVEGMGGATLRVEDYLAVTIRGMGQVTYIGRPHVSQSHMGMGFLRRIG